MAYEQRDNSGTLFINDRKTDKNSKLPDRKGDAIINGQAMWISGWLKDGKNGTQFLSLSFTPKEEGGNTQSSKPNTTSTNGAPF